MLGNEKTLQLSNMVLGLKSMMLVWFSLFLKKTTYDSLSLLVVFDYFAKNLAYRKSSIVIVSSDFVKGVPHEKSFILIVFKLL